MNGAAADEILLEVIDFLLLFAGLGEYLFLLFVVNALHQYLTINKL